MARAEERALSTYERRLWMEVDRILYQNYLTPRTVTDFWAGDREAVIWHLRQMKERIVRSIVVSEYVEIDDVLNRAILKRATGPRKQATRQRARVIQAMLERLYPVQKLEIIRSFREVPKLIGSHIGALNSVRNTLAHRFPLHKVPRSQRLYKACYDLFTRRGLERFRADMWEVHEFFDPTITASALQLVRTQRARNRLRTGRQAQNGQLA